MNKYRPTYLRYIYLYFKNIFSFVIALKSISRCLWLKNEFLLKSCFFPKQMWKNNFERNFEILKNF